MPTPTYTPLATITLSSTDSSIVFASIPGTYKDLVLVAGFSVSTGTTIYYRFNGDSGANYNTVAMSGAQGQARSSSSANRNDINVSWYVGLPTSQQVNGILQVMDYSATDKQKTVLQRMNQSDEVAATAGRWANTAAITSITVAPNSGNFEAGSVFSLYGIAG